MPRNGDRSRLVGGWRLPPPQVRFDQKRTEGEECGSHEQSRSDERPAVFLPGGSDRDEVEDEEDSMRPTGPFDGLRLVGEVF